MEQSTYYIFEILDNGSMRKVSLRNFKTKKEAETNIMMHMNPIDRKRLIAVKVNR